jgi:hypothetical protein
MVSQLNDNCVNAASTPSLQVELVSSSSVTRLGQILLFGHFYLNIFLQFHLNKLFQNMVCCANFSIKFEFWATVLATFLKIGHIFFHFLVTLVPRVTIMQL